MSWNVLFDRFEVGSEIHKVLFLFLETLCYFWWIYINFHWEQIVFDNNGKKLVCEYYLSDKCTVPISCSGGQLTAPHSYCLHEWPWAFVSFFFRTWVIENPFLRLTAYNIHLVKGNMACWEAVCIYMCECLALNLFGEGKQK